MYTFDYLEDIRKLETFLYDCPEKTEHSFESERDEFHHFQGRCGRDLSEKIRRKRKELLSNDAVKNIIVDFEDDSEIIIRNG